MQHCEILFLITSFTTLIGLFYIGAMYDVGDLERFRKRMDKRIRRMFKK
jgi:hypothetical protein